MAHIEALFKHDNYLPFTPNELLSAVFLMDANVSKSLRIWVEGPAHELLTYPNPNPNPNPNMEGV